jgi:hypothetical protein
MEPIAGRIQLEHEQRQSSKQTTWFCCGKVDVIPLAPREFQSMLDERTNDELAERYETTTKPTH